MGKFANLSYLAIGARYNLKKFKEKMKKALFAALTGALCSLNLTGADEDIAKFEAGCNC